MRRFHVLLVVMLAAVAIPIALPRTAVGSDWWCWDDPVVVVDGRAFHVLAGVPMDARPSISLADIVITVPNGVNASLKPVASPQFPQQVRIEPSGTVDEDGGFTVTVRLAVYAPAGTAAALRIREGGRNVVTVTGEAGQQMTASLTLSTKPGKGMQREKQ